MNVFQAVTLAQFKATEVPHPWADLELMGPMAVIAVVMGASLPRGSPMADAGRARGRLNSFDGKDDFGFLV